LAVAASEQAAAQDQTYAEKLGYPKGSRVVILHNDDAGMSHSANEGTIKALEEGVINSMSTMMPCSWVPEFAQYLAENPGVDNGLHLTMNAEWKRYRWQPAAGRDAVPGLVDADGYMWSEVEYVVENATPDEVETEIRAQLALARKIGMPVTHLDSHMGTLFASPAFFERYVKVGVEEGIPVLIAGGHLTYAKKNNPEAVAMLSPVAAGVWMRGLPVIDDIYTFFEVGGSTESRVAHLVNDLTNLKPGITEIIVHCTVPGSEFKYISSTGDERRSDLDVMLHPDIKKTLTSEGILLTTWRELSERRKKVKN
jgi:hypothetical protein